MNRNFSDFNYDKRTHSFSQEASQLGLFPGQFPEYVEIKGRTATVHFSFDKMVKNTEGEVLFALYKAEVNGQEMAVIIWND